MPHLSNLKYGWANKNNYKIIKDKQTKMSNDNSKS